VSPTAGERGYTQRRRRTRRGCGNSSTSCHAHDVAWSRHRLNACCGPAGVADSTELVARGRPYDELLRRGRSAHPAGLGNV